MSDFLQRLDPSDADFSALENIPIPVLTLFLSHFDTKQALIDHLQVNPSLDETVLYPNSVQKWTQYLDRIASRTQPPVDEASKTTGRSVSIFGTCRRCGSSRLLVTTRQLRRADEGMATGVSALHRDAGDADRGPAMQGLRPRH